MVETIEEKKEDFLRPSSTDGHGKFFYDPIQCTLKSENLKAAYKTAVNQDLLFTFIFSDNDDVPDDSLFVTPKGRRMTLGEIKSYPLDNHFLNNLVLWINYHCSYYKDWFLPIENKKLFRKVIFDRIDNTHLFNDDIFTSKIVPNIGSYFINNTEKNGREYIHSIKILDKIFSRENKIGFADYEMKFSYRSHKPINRIEDFPVFLDSEGTCHIIRPLENSSLPEGDGIYIHKLTPSSRDNKSYTRLELPNELDTVVKAPMINGIFINSFESFKDMYLENYKTPYIEDNKFDEFTVFNIKKLVGNFLYNDSSLNSYGLISQIIGFSLTTDKLYVYTPKIGISEILNLTPKNLGEEKFNNALLLCNISRNLLDKNDFILRKTNIGSGSMMISSSNVRSELIKVNKPNSNLNNIKNNLLDNDLLLFNETGFAVFQTREAAERCMKFKDGNIESYVNYINNKIKNKGVKNSFLEKLMDNIISILSSSFAEILKYIMKPIVK